LALSFGETFGNLLTKEVKESMPSAVSLEHIERRRRALGLSMAELSRRSNVGYRRLWYALAGEQIDAPELARIERALQAAERADVYSTAS
jgi:hypothetical protein